MRDRLLIYSGLLLFIVLVTFPVWQGIWAQSSTRAPELKAPTERKQCVAPLGYMRKAHMTLLMEWRDAKVRRQEQSYTAQDGTVYPISLTGTCLTQCHASKEQFCDRCHSYAGVPAPDCWSCHTSPKADSEKMVATATGVKR